jgi:hypothetical protein
MLYYLLRNAHFGPPTMYHLIVYGVGLVIVFLLIYILSLADKGKK